MKCQENSQHISSWLMPDKGTKTYTGEKTAFLMNGGGNIYSYYIMLKLGLSLPLYRVKLNGLIA